MASSIPASRESMTIGALAQSAGVGVETVRYYQRRGLLLQPARLYGTIRRYGPDDASRLRFIRRARDMGFGLDAIAELVSLWHNRKRSSASVKRIAQKHLDELGQRIEALQAMQRTLDALLCHCPGDDRPDCPILDDLAHP